MQITEEGYVVCQSYCRGLGKQQHQIQRVIVGICVDEKSIKFVCFQTDSEAVLEVETDLIIDQPEVFVAVTVNPFENVQIGVVE